MADQQDQTQIESNQLTRDLIQTSVWQSAQTVALTVSGGIEVNTRPLMQAAITAGKTVLLPKTMPHRQMAFLPFNGDDKQLVVSTFGIPEPVFDATLVNQAPDLVVVPAIAFDVSTRQRIGFGAGYYDRFLATYKGQTVAMVPSVMRYETAQWPLEEHDVPIHKLITLR